MRVHPLIIHQISHHEPHSPRGPMRPVPDLPFFSILVHRASTCPPCCLWPPISAVLARGGARAPCRTMHICCCIGNFLKQISFKGPPYPSSEFRWLARIVHLWSHFSPLCPSPSCAHCWVVCWWLSAFVVKELLHCLFLVYALL